MAEPPNTQSARPRIAEELVEAAKKAFDPSFTLQSRESNLKAYQELVTRYRWLYLTGL